MVLHLSRVSITQRVLLWSSGDYFAKPKVAYFFSNLCNSKFMIKDHGGSIFEQLHASRVTTSSNFYFSMIYYYSSQASFLAVYRASSSLPLQTDNGDKRRQCRHFAEVTEAAFPRMSPVCSKEARVRDSWGLLSSRGLRPSTTATGSSALWTPTRTEAAKTAAAHFITQGDHRRRVLLTQATIFWVAATIQLLSRAYSIQTHEEGSIWPLTYLSLWPQS